MAAPMKAQGWYIKDEEYEECKKLTKSGSSQEVTGVLLNSDLKQIGVSSLPDDFAKSKISKLEGPLVLQIQKLRNITAPSVRQESGTAARMFRFSLTDGCQNVAAIEMEPLHNVGFTTSPGMKLLLKGSLQVNQSIIILTNSNCKLLGGQVDHMHDKWLLDKELKMLSRNSNRMDGPIPFVPFGQKVNKDHVEKLGGKFKSLEIAGGNSTAAPTERDNSEFNAQRQAVISEALQKAAGQRKTYGGIKQNTADAPLEMAEYRRPERKPKKTTVDDKDPNVSDDEESYGRGRGRRGRRNRGDDEDGEMLVTNTRPSAANTLFDFLGDKFAADEKPASSGGAQSHRPHTAHHDSGQGRGQYGGDRRQQQGSYQGQRSDSSGYQERQRQQNSYSSHPNQQSRSGPHQNNRQYDSNRQNHQSSLPAQHNQQSRSAPHQNEGRQRDGNRQNQHTRPAQNTNNRGYENRNMDDGQKQQPDQRSNYQNRSSANEAHQGTSQYGRHTGYQDKPMDKRNDGQRDNGQHKDRKSSYGEGRPKSLQHPSSGGGKSTPTHEQKNRPGSAPSGTQHKQEGSTGARDSKTEVNKAQPRPDSGKPDNRKPDNRKPDSGKPDNRKGAERFAGKMYSDDVRQSAESKPSSGSTSSNKNDQKTGSTTPTVGDILLAKYWEDGQFYKFKVAKVKSPAVLTGLFIEYGNSEDVKISDTRPLPSSNSKPRGDNGNPRGDKPIRVQSDRGHNSNRENNYNNPRIHQQRTDNSQHEYSQQPQYQQYNNQRQYGSGHFPNHQEYQGDLRQGMSFGRSHPGNR